MSDDDDARWREVDRELDQLRRDTTADMDRLIELLARGDAAPERDVLSQVAVIIMRHQQLALTVLRHLNYEVRRQRQDLRTLSP